jgi:hypothetical protein
VRPADPTRRDTTSTWRRLAGALTLAFALAVSHGASAATFTVVNTADGGVGSLRAAIIAANTNPGPDTIAFNIAGAGPHAIAVLSSLPGINDPVLIDGYTQPGAGPNTGAIGSNAQIRIELVGPATVGVGSLTLLVGSAGSTIRGLAINRFFGSQLTATGGGTNCVITGNFIGTDPGGTIAYPSGPGTRTGITVAGAGCRIGGSARADRNVVSGVSGTGIFVGNADVTIQGNLVGTTATGGGALGNSCGITIGNAIPAPGASLISNVVIGGENVGASLPRNVISGNTRCGIEVNASENERIEGNIIGLAAFPIVAIANTGPGIQVGRAREVRIGTVIPGQVSNTIGGNTGPGVLIYGPANSTESARDVMVVGNFIQDNDGLAIDLATSTANGVTANDPLDADLGANDLQNFPELTSVTYSATQTTLQGRLHSEPSRLFFIDVYTATSCHPSGHGGGAAYVDFTSTTTNAAGLGTFTLVVDEVLDEGFATATATAGPALIGPTSEFSTCLKLGDVIFANGFQPPP